jgi:tetratricopeptide (TPR) repeat protein
MKRAQQLVLAFLAASSMAAYAQTDAQPAVDAARAAAQADRNREAAESFRSAIAQAPQRRRELLQEFADQLLYSGNAREAIPLYREVLAAPRSEDERQRAAKGLGLAYLWTDQPTLALSVFAALHRERPDDDDVSRNLGRALSWSGRQREAAAHLQEHLRRRPQDGEARVQLAQSQAWMGRPDGALGTLASEQRDDARKLRTQLEREMAPRTGIDYQRSSQSDGLDLRQWRAAHAVSLAQGRGAVGVRYERFSYDREDGTDFARVERPLLFGRWRFSDAFEWNGEIGRERISPRASPSIEFTPHSTWLTWWPNDIFRVDLSSGRSDFDNLRSLRQGITHRDTGLSMDVTPTERHRATFRLQRSDISDGNRRDMAQAEGEWRVRTHPDIWIGARYTHFEFARQLDNGYFNPLRFDSLLGTVRAHWRPFGDASPWEVGAWAAWGREHAVPDGNKPAYDVSLRVGYRFDPATRIELRAQRFSSRTSTSTGFARSILAVSLEKGW